MPKHYKKFLIYFSIFIIFVILFFVLEFSLFCKINYRQFDDKGKSIPLAEKLKNFKYYKAKVFSIKENKSYFKSYKGNPAKKPIIILGTHLIIPFYESDANNKKLRYSPSHNLCDLTGRTVYSFPIDKGNPKTFYNLFDSKYIQKKITQSPEAVIYVFNPEQIDSMYQTQIDYYYSILNINYQEKNDELVLKPVHFKFLNSLQTVKFFQNISNNAKVNYAYDHNLELFELIMEEIYAKIKEAFPDTKKIIFLIHPVESASDVERFSQDDYPVLEDAVVDCLEEIGYKVFDMEDLTKLPIRKEKYRFPDGKINHEGWNDILNTLKKEAEL